MSLSPGTRLGPHEVIGPIGAGGMGEVYRAHDTHLGRDVAIKILPAALAADAERLARFEREARTLASLNHPNIAAIYGLERDAVTTALVMELVEGPTLADRIAQGPIALDEALAIARQIADALDAAHERAIVHRDLKPANIKVRDDGTVKVLDFGLAKTLDAAGEEVAVTSAGFSMSPTLASPAMTQAGVLLGTAAYMSPEQARGKVVDRRADIWAFGCVLFEMVTGRRAFGGDDVTEILAGIVKDQPDLADVPPSLRGLIGRCLEKDPRRRLRDIGDAMSLVTTSGDTPAVPVPARARWATAAGWALAGVLAIALAVVFRGNAATDHTAAAPAARFQIDRGAADVYNRTTTAFAVSPNGQWLAYYAPGSDGPQTLTVRTLATGEVREVPGSASAVPNPNALFWSADSRQLVRGSSAGTQVFDVGTGRVRSLCDCRFVGGSWSQDGTILAGGIGVGLGIVRLSFDHREPVAITKVDRAASEQDTWPVFLPDGRRFLFTRGRGRDEATYVGTLDGGTPTRVGDGSARAIVSRPDGRMYLVAVDAAGVVALPFDSAAARVTGEATTIVAGAAAASVSQTGVMATSAAGDRPRTVPTWFDRKGTPIGTVGQPAFIDGLALSTDGRKLARSETMPGRGSTVWLEDLTTGSRSQLTLEGPGATPVLAPGAATLAYTSSRKGVNLPYQRAVDGTGGETPLFPYDWHAWVNDWSRDGRWILFTSPPRGGVGNELWVVPATGPDRTPRLYAGGARLQQQGQFSPDGRFVAYGGADQSGAWGIYVQPFPNAAEGKWLVATGGVEPRWSPDGTELFYFSGRTLYAVPVRLRPTFSAGTPVALFDAPIVPNYNQDGHRWQVGPDGRRFLVLADAGGNAAPPLGVLVNWPSLLPR